jgi:hypothetical protein
VGLRGQRRPAGPNRPWGPFRLLVLARMALACRIPLARPPVLSPAHSNVEEQKVFPECIRGASEFAERSRAANKTMPMSVTFRRVGP